MNEKYNNLVQVNKKKFETRELLKVEKKFEV